MKVEPEKDAAVFRSRCPLASALDLVGDKWSLLIVRDLHLGKRVFSELEGSEEGISPAVLSARLKMLEQSGILRREIQHSHPIRVEYRLTEAGEALVAAMIPLAEWGHRTLPGRYPVPRTARQRRIAREKGER